MASAMIAGELASNSFWACSVFLLRLPLGRPRPNVLPGSKRRPRIMGRLLSQCHLLSNLGRAAVCHSPFARAVPQFCRLKQSELVELAAKKKTSADVDVWEAEYHAGEDLLGCTCRLRRPDCKSHRVPISFPGLSHRACPCRHRYGLRISRRN